MALSPHLAITRLLTAQANKEVTLNDAVQGLDRRNGYLAIGPITGGTFPISADDARFGVLEITGTLTANATVQVPNEFYCNHVWFNNTTGNFTVSVQYGTSGPSLTIPRGCFSPTRYNVTGGAIIFDRGRNGNPWLPEFIVERITSNQTLTAATDTVVQFNSETLDNSGSFDPTTNYRFTAPAAGLYEFHTQVEIEVTAAGTGNTNAQVSIRRNGTITRRGDLIQGPAAATMLQRVSARAMIVLASGDTVDVVARQDQTGSTSRINFGSDKTFFYGRAVRLG